MVLPSVRKRTRSGNRKGPRRGPAGQPRAQALGSVAGPDVRPEWAVQAASAFPGWHPGRPCRQGSHAGLSCSTLSGSSAYSKRASARHAGKIYDDRHGSGAAAYCQTSAPHQAFTGNNHAAPSHSLTCGQQPAHSGAIRISPRGRSRNRSRYRYRFAVDLKSEGHCLIIFRMPIPTPIPTPTPRILDSQSRSLRNPRQPERRSLSGSHGQRPWLQVEVKEPIALKKSVRDVVL